MPKTLERSLFNLPHFLRAKSAEEISPGQSEASPWVKKKKRRALKGHWKTLGISPSFASLYQRPCRAQRWLALPRAALRLPWAGLLRPCRAVTCVRLNRRCSKREASAADGRCMVDRPLRGRFPKHIERSELIFRLRRPSPGIARGAPDPPFAFRMPLKNHANSRLLNSLQQ